MLIIVQNMPVPLDRRVWLECQALIGDGTGVSVICPKGPGDPWRQTIDGIRIYKYPAPPAARGLLGYSVEFIYCWTMTALLSVLVALRDGFGAIQACNPPDTYWALAALWKLLGKRFVYDQHDLNPEVYLSRFGQPVGAAGRTQLAVLKWLERRTYRQADRVISTNDFYREVAQTRGGVNPESVTVVRSGPDTTAMRPVSALPELRHGRAYLAVYLGIMGPQDGVDQALRAFREVVYTHGRKDCHFALLGFGDCLDEMRALSLDMQLEEFVTFTGRVDSSDIADYLSTADLGICPDPKSPLNDVSTMNKTMEYMAYCLPILSFDLRETRISAGEAAVYVESGDLDAFASRWVELIDDEEQRVQRGMFARERVSKELDWAPQAAKYLTVWRHVLRLPSSSQEPSAAAVPRSSPTVDPRGRPYINLDDPDELEDFIRGRAGSG